MIIFNKEEVIEAILKAISAHNIKGDILISSQPKDRYLPEGCLKAIPPRYNSYRFLASVIYANPIFTFHITEEMYTNLSYLNEIIDDILFHMPRFEGSEIFLGSVEENKPYIKYDGEFYDWSMLHGYLNDCEEVMSLDNLYQDFLEHNMVNDFGFTESLILKISTPEGLKEYLNTPAYNLPAAQAILSHFRCIPTGRAIIGEENYSKFLNIVGFNK